LGFGSFKREEIDKIVLDIVSAELHSSDLKILTQILPSADMFGW